MKVVPLLLALLLFSPMKSEARTYGADELESLLAPVALQPDEVLWNVLEASTAPHDVIDAASGRGARTPAVGALLAYPELLSQMAGSRQWLADLGDAYLSQRNEVLAAVQVLRQRAGVAGYQIHPHHVVHYNPIVVYGPAWRPHHHHHHLHWRPWVARPVVRHVIVHKPAQAQVHRHHEERRNGGPSPAVRMQREQAGKVREYHRVPESQRQPIVQPRHFEQRGFQARAPGQPHRRLQ
jgi:hypothetical protein